MDMDAVYMEMIAAGGMAKSIIYDALDASIAGDDERAWARLAEADRYLGEAHVAQSRVLQAWAAAAFAPAAGVEGAASGAPADATSNDHLGGPLLMHAQDLVMTAMTERALAERIIKLAARKP